MSRKILIVEDDADINNLLYKILRKTGYELVQAFSGSEAQLRLEIEPPDLVLLDLMLPGIDGETLLHRIREEMRLNIPVIVISAKASLDNKVNVMMQGADDYITKPFEPEEVLVRVHAVLRRYKNIEEAPGSDKCEFKNLCLYKEARNVTVCGSEITLTRHEYEILLLLLEHPEKVYSRESIYQNIWENGYYGEDNTVNVHVSNIRKKIAEHDGEQEYIKTVWGIGFKMA